MILQSFSSRAGTTFPIRIVDSARRIDRELIETLRQMIRDREAITGAAVVRRMSSINHISTLTRDPWRAAQLAEGKAEQARLERPAEQLTGGSSGRPINQNSEFRGLTYFLCIARVGSFGRAARELSVEQAALSHHIRNLESGLGVELFVRHSRGVTLTQAGLRLSSYLAAGASGSARTATSKLEPMQLSVGIPSGLGSLIIPRAIEDFRRENPDAMVTLAEGSSSSLEELIVSNRIDIAVLHDPGRFDGIKLDPVFVEPLGLVSSSSVQQSREGQRTSLAELATARLILPSGRYNVRRKLDDIAFRHGLQLQIIMEVDSITLIKTLVQRGVGSTVLPLLAVREETGRSLLDFRPLDHPFLRTAYVIAVAHAAEGGLAGTFAHTLRSIITQQVTAGRWPATRLIGSA
jgi:LysR family nitrogen assimilation transcriptional regulator